MEDKRYRSPSLAVDAVVLRDIGGMTEVLLIRRKYPPWQGKLAFPGGFVDYDEDPVDAVLRELFEEAGVEGSNPEFYAVKGSPKRDPRKHIVSIFYLVQVDKGAIPIAGDDAAEAEWINIEELVADDISGDHFDIIEQLRK
ncbi:MAG: hypothetical protein CMA12_05205 [Euryarchaeota archaeon]|nr:hypothetical protein [Euryarchaeota archaeon]OUW22230.1 MAG: hypothetical protein CBD33_03070 [Euryarchaeota archaeon TMED173]|tara:strand:- start:266 stop:688 length:423 start_codon:yes stop_codon:yes gene_type:complete